MLWRATEKGRSPQVAMNSRLNRWTCPAYSEKLQRSMGVPNDPILSMIITAARGPPRGLRARRRYRERRDRFAESGRGGASVRELAPQVPLKTAGSLTAIFSGAFVSPFVGTAALNS